MSVYKFIFGFKFSNQIDFLLPFDSVYDNEYETNYMFFVTGSSMPPFQDIQSVVGRCSSLEASVHLLISENDVFQICGKI